jgi:hypothetical protein
VRAGTSKGKVKWAALAEVHPGALATGPYREEEEHPRRMLNLNQIYIQQKINSRLTLEIYACLGFYEVSNGRFVPTFRYNLSVSSSSSPRRWSADLIDTEAEA